MSHRANSCLVLTLIYSNVAFGGTPDYASNAIRRQAAEVRQRATEVRRQAAGVEASAARLQSETQRMRSQRYEADSRARRVDSDISTLGRETNRLQQEERDLSTRTTTALQEQMRLAEANKVMRNRLSTLLQEQYNLQARLKFKEGELADLKDFSERLSIIRKTLSLLNNQQVEARRALAEASSAHAGWMSQLVGLVKSNAPPFKDLKDTAGIQAAEFRVRQFTSKILSRAEVREKERDVVRLGRALSQTSSAVQDQLRELARSRGLAVFNTYSKEKAPAAQWRERDEAVYRNIELGLQIEALTKLLDERREYLVRIIPAMWERMLDVRRDGVNLKASSDSGQTAGQALDLADLTLRIPAEVENPLKAANQSISHGCGDQARKQLGDATRSLERLVRQIDQIKDDAAAISRAQLEGFRTQIAQIQTRVDGAPATSVGCP